ncbi:MAG: hypothetical protein H0T73_12185 [Ardenticatenales bacterium]|nr:hypothetical protein [Ardenticatenales bacterium]
MATKSAIVAVIQLQWKRQQNESTLREELQRFLRLAQNKHADVVLFPEMTGLLLAGPLAQEKKEALKKKGGFLDRLFGGGTPELSDVIPTLIAEHSEALTEQYKRLFGDLAREFRMLIVAGTLLARSEEGVIQHRAGVFDADGSFLGWQSKLHLTAAEKATAQEGDALNTFEGSFGRFGVLVGNDLLFPELARALAYRGCVGILCPTLAQSRSGWQRQRLVAAARAQENQLFLGQSFLVGESDLFPDNRDPLVGRSAVLVPVELSPRADGLMSEVGAEKVEGVITGEWNTAALHNLWHTSEVCVRDMGRGLLFHELLAFDYQSGATIAERTSDVEEVAEIKVDIEAVLPPEALALPVPTVEVPVAPALPQPTPEVATPPAQETPVALDAARAVTELSAPPTPEGTLVAPVDAEEHPHLARSEPIIDPESGYYLGEKPVEED